MARVSGEVARGREILGGDALLLNMLFEHAIGGEEPQSIFSARPLSGWSICSDN